MYAGTSNTADSGDILFYSNNGTERAQISADPANINNLIIRTNNSSNRVLLSNTSSCNIGTGTGTTSCSSDARLKNIVGSATGNLAKIMQLQPTYYTWKSEAANPQLRIGLIAQNVQTQFPETVTLDDNGYLSLDYSALVSPLIGAVQEQQAQITTLNNTVASLQASNISNGGNVNGNLSIAGDVMVGGTLVVAKNAIFQADVTVIGALHTADIYVSGHLVTVGMAPQVTLGSALGAGQGGVGDPMASLDGTDSAGTLSVTAGTQNVISGSLAHIAFNKAFGGSYKVVVSASNEKAADLRIYTVKTSTGFDIVTPDAVQTGNNYQFDYVVIGTQ